ncbi:hypothetical protein [Nocardia aurea]|uniref:hypothetical protein n=1 Tax=Nocardia aurea TaxID=2144174 RepID=UPI001300663A|nr:hypothetical protein [Nocardia aurea]
MTSQLHGCERELHKLSHSLIEVAMPGRDFVIAGPVSGQVAASVGVLSRMGDSCGGEETGGSGRFCGPDSAPENLAAQRSERKMVNRRGTLGE